MDLHRRTGSTSVKPPKSAWLRPRASRTVLTKFAAEIIIWSTTALGTLPGDRCTPDRFAIGSANAETAVNIVFTIPHQV